MNKFNQKFVQSSRSESRAGRTSSDTIKTILKHGKW